MSAAATHAQLPDESALRDRFADAAARAPGAATNVAAATACGTNEVRVRRWRKGESELEATQLRRVSTWLTFVAPWPIATRELATYELVQCRAAHDAQATKDYGAGLAAGEITEPLHVFVDKDGTRYLADGHHRLAGAREAGVAELAVQLHRGTRLEALRFGIKCGRERNALRFTAADRRASAVLLFAADPKASDSAIARDVGASHQSIGRWRAEWAAHSSNGQVSTHRVGTDGRVQDTSRIGKASAKRAPKVTSEKVAVGEIPQLATRADSPAPSALAFTPRDDSERAAVAKFEALAGDAGDRGDANPSGDGRPKGFEGGETNTPAQTEIPPSAYAPVPTAEPWDLGRTLGELNSAFLDIEQQCPACDAPLVVAFLESWTRKLQGCVDG